MEGRIAGIDLGTTYSSCGVVKINKVELAPFNSSDYREPSWYHYNGASEIYGSAAKDKAATEIELCMYDSKRFIGKTYNEVKKDVGRYVNVINRDDKIVYEIKNSEKQLLGTFTPQTVHEKLLKKFKRDLDSFNGEQLTRAVIGIPATYNKSQREATMKAALCDTTSPSGVNTVYKSVKLIKEPVAVAISYLYDLSNPVNVTNNSKILIYDFGGGTFDLALVEYDNGYLKVIATDGKDHLGGQDITNAIYEYYEKKYKKEIESNDIMKTKKKKGRLLKACEEVKKLFVDENAENGTLDFGDSDELSYALFERLSDPFIDDTIKLTKDFLKKNSVKANELYKVIGTGGSSMLRNVKEKLSKVFTKDKILISKTPFEDVAKGVVLYGYKFMQRETIAPIGIRATRDKKKRFIEILPVGTKWGKTITVTGVNDNKAPDALFKFYEYDLSEENYLGKLILPFSDKYKNKKINSIQVTLKVKINNYGELEATASYEDGDEKKVIIRLFKTKEDIE